MKKLFFLVPLMAALCFLAAGCSRAKPKADGAAPVVTAKVVETNVPVLIDPAPVGHVMPVLSVTIRPQIGGIISTVDFHEGQEVKAGDRLFTIDPRPAQAALVQAQANLQRDAAQLANSKIQFDREQKLFESKLVSQDEYDTSRAGFNALMGTVAADRAGVTNAELNLEYTQIRSPIEGRTGGLQFHEGNVVKSPDDVLLTINQIHPIYVAFAVAEQFLPEIQRQMQAHPLMVTASFKNMDGAQPSGELTFVDNAVDTATGTIQLKATFPNENSALWPGQYVNVQLTLSELQGVVVVPSQAVQNGPDSQFVYVLKADATVEQRTINTGITFQGQTVVLSGVKTGENVITDGQLRLAPGVKVVVKAPSASTP